MYHCSSMFNVLSSNSKCGFSALQKMILAFFKNSQKHVMRGNSYVHVNLSSCSKCICTIATGVMWLSTCIYMRLYLLYILYILMHDHSLN